jgi:hypothetical protein
MAARYFISVLAAAILLSVNTTQCQQQDDDVLLNLSARYFELVQAAGFIDASLLLHYPREYTEKELIDDRTLTRKSMQIFADELGSIGSIQDSPLPQNIFRLTICGGTSTYWSDHPYAKRTSYSVQFEKAGDGFIDFSFCNIYGEWEIREVGYSLKDNQPGAKSILTTILQRILEIKPE